MARWSRKESNSTTFQCSPKRYSGAWATTGNSMSRRCRLSNHITMLGRGDSPFVGIPIFPSRFFRHSSIYYNVASGIKKPEDFKGKKVGTPEFAMTAGVWIRGFFKDDYGVRPQDMKWFLGGQVEPGRKERVKLDLPPEMSVQAIPGRQTLNSMLESGEIDALISARSPPVLPTAREKCAGCFPITKTWRSSITSAQRFFRSCTSWSSVNTSMSPSVDCAEPL